MQRSVAFVLLLFVACILHVGSTPAKQRRSPESFPRKPGICPDPIEPQPIGTPGAIRCGRFCNGDHECFGDRKCCATGCGTDCKEPI